jgi:hypothetical protein
MSVWRRKAMVLLPKERRELQQPDYSTYLFLSALLRAVVHAHQVRDEALLREYYAYPAWCLRQRAEHLWNAAGTAFYEHLADHEETCADMPRWVSRDIYNEVRELIARRAEVDVLRKIDAQYGRA